jgi:hypothetical protein
VRCWPPACRRIVATTVLLLPKASRRPRAALLLSMPRLAAFLWPRFCWARKPQKPGETALPLLRCNSTGRGRAPQPPHFGRAEAVVPRVLEIEVGIAAAAKPRCVVPGAGRPHAVRRPRPRRTEGALRHRPQGGREAGGARVG